MSAKIYWFSGTGNSLAVAKGLAEKLPSRALRNCRRHLEVAQQTGLPGIPRLFEALI